MKKRETNNVNKKTKKTKKNKKTNSNESSKQVKLVWTAIALVVIIILLSGTNSAAPGDLLYTLDRKVEEVTRKLKIENTDKIYYELDLATERLEELRDTETNTEKTSQLMTDFRDNLNQATNLLKTSAESGEYSDQELSEIVRDLIELRAASFARTITVREDSTSIKSVRKEVKKGNSYINDFITDVFDIAINNIEEGTDFDTFAKNMLLIKVREISTLLGYMQEDLTMLVPQISEEQLTELTEILNEIRDDFFDIRDDVGIKPNLEMYEELNKIHNRLDDDFSSRLVEISQESAGISL